MKLKLNEKEYTVKFGYTATVKSGLLKQLAQITKRIESDEEPMELADKMMMWLPEFLLVGLQRYHEDEFGCDWDNEKDRKEKVDKAFNLLDEYFDQEDSDFMGLFQDLQNEMMKNSFLSKMFQAEQAKVEK